MAFLTFIIPFLAYLPIWRLLPPSLPSCPYFRAPGKALRIGNNSAQKYPLLPLLAPFRRCREVRDVQESPLNAYMFWLAYCMLHAGISVGIYETLFSRLRLVGFMLELTSVPSEKVLGASERARGRETEEQDVRRRPNGTANRLQICKVFPTLRGMDGPLSLLLQMISPWQIDNRTRH